MPSRRWLTVIAAVALAHGLFFIWYQQPDWAAQWSDQEGYRRLGAALAETGRFTRYPDAGTFVPEVLRTPGYPLFVAAVYATVGTDQINIAAAQTLLFVLLCLVVYAMARRLTGPREAVAAAALTAAFPMFPYYGALVMTELWTTVVLAIGMAFGARALGTRATRDYVLAGLFLGWAALSRPAFMLLAPFLFVGALPFWWVTRDRRWLSWGWTLGAFALVLLPWLSFNYVVTGHFSMAPAGGVGRGLWEGTWQGRWPGRLHNELTHLADDIEDMTALDRRIEALARETGEPAGPMLTYVHQWRRIRLIWDTPADPNERAVKRVEADQEYLRVALANITADPLGHVWRRLSRGLFVLWLADIPLRYSEINDAPPALIRAIWMAQAGLGALAIWGAILLARAGRVPEAWLLVMPLIYVAGVHVPLLTEARQSLPVKPLLLILSTHGGAGLLHRFTSPRTAGS